MIISPKFASFIILSICILVPIRPLAANLAANPYLVIDAGNGAIIAANRESDRWYPASLTKLMTAYVTMKALSDGEIKTGSPVRISKRAKKMPASRMAYKIGTLLRIDTALKVLIVKSANDVAIALAESVAGSVEKFVDRMNKSARSLGMTATRFVNPNGLHSTSQVTSARDLAILARRILLDFPQYSQWFAIPAIRTPNKTHYSYNLLLERFAGANGMKTGFLCASGYNMVASAKRNNRQLIAVVLGGKSQTHRAVLAARLLSEAFARPDQLIGSVLSKGNNTGARPENMRPVLCTQKARKNRYEPGAGKAVINSTYLSKRKITRQPTPIQVGGIDAKPGKAYAMRLFIPDRRVSIPTKRPQYAPPQPVDSQRQSGNYLGGSIPVPVRRPNS